MQGDEINTQSGGRQELKQQWTEHTAQAELGRSEKADTGFLCLPVEDEVGTEAQVNKDRNKGIS